MRPHDVYETTFDESTGKTIESTCPECEGTVIADGGERHCEACGLVIGEYQIDHGATARSHPADDEKRTHVGAPRTPTKHDHGLTTEIGRFRDANGNPIEGAARRRLTRLRTQHRRARHSSKRERNRERGCREVARLTGALGLGRSLEEQAAIIFRQAQDTNLLLGRSIEAVAAGSVHAACRCAGLPRSLDEVAAIARVDADRVSNAYRVLNDELRLPTTPQTPREFIPRYASELDVSDQVRKRALDLADRAIETGVANGRQPSGVAAACLYHAGREAGCARTQADLAEVAAVSVVTVRTGWKALCRALDAGDSVVDGRASHELPHATDAREEV